MSRNTGNKSAAPSKSGSPLLTGLLVGMVIGVALAAGLAWFLLKSPSPFVPQETVVAKHTPEVIKPFAPAESARAVAPTPAPVAASAVEDGKPRFEFYKVLTDKQDAVPAKSADKPQTKEAQPETPTAKANLYLQAGSFSNPDDAEKLKAKLTLIGMEVSVSAVTIADKGVWHRVRVGPFKNADEMNSARGTLKQNGIDSNRAQ